MVTEAVRERYLRDPLPIRLGGLAADLARVASFAENPKNQDAVANLLEEGKYFAEWAALEAPMETQDALREIQVLMALWQLRWLAGRPDPAMPQQARLWSDRLLKAAGLL
jgi:hypothetical protein